MSPQKNKSAPATPARPVNLFVVSSLIDRPQPPNEKEINHGRVSWQTR
jgi:hypothetical protein